ncbi:hypothetical protein [Longispora urticae]
MLSKRALRRVVLTATATTATAVALLVGQAPAQAGIFYTAGAFSSQAACEQWRADYLEGYYSRPCAYQDRAGTANDGWYTSYMLEF